MKSIYSILHYKNVIMTFVLILVVVVSSLDIEAKESVKVLSVKQQHNIQGSEKQIQNPHWRDDSCQVCHKGKPKRNNLKLRTSDINKLCNKCHSQVSKQSYIHPFGMIPSKKIIKKMPGSFSSAVKRGGGR